jgi:hypothetical protein
MVNITHGTIFWGCKKRAPGSGRRGTVETSAAEEVTQGNTGSWDSGWEGQANPESKNSIPTRSPAASQRLGRK